MGYGYKYKKAITAKKAGESGLVTGIGGGVGALIGLAISWYRQSGNETPWAPTEDAVIINAVTWGCAVLASAFRRGVTNWWEHH